MRPRVDAILVIARHELAERLRNRWIWTVAALLMGSGLALAFFGTAPVGVAGRSDNGLVMASLMNLSAYLVPLLALILGAGAIIDEKQRGTLDLYLTYPISPRDYYAGTFLGYASALIAALAGSLLPLGLVLRRLGRVALDEYLLLVGLVVLLGVAFLSLSFTISILSRDRGRSVASAVLAWVAAVFVFDLVLVGVLVLYPAQIPTPVFGTLLLLNPADVFRLLCFELVGSAASPLGLATVSLPLPAVALVAALVFWIVTPAAAGHLIFRRRAAADQLV